MQTNVLQWLDESAVKRPDKLAICDSEIGIRYGDFRKKSIALARKIIEIEGRMEEGGRHPVAVFMGRSVKVLVSFMGVAYSRNFYSHIDPEMPESRVKKILEILRPRIVVTLRELQQDFEKLYCDAEYVFYEEVSYAPSFEETVKKRTDQIIDTDLLGIYFTSGSSGVPKGVAVMHRNIISVTDWMTERFDISPEDNLGNQTPFYYDMSVTDIYGCIKAGATLFIIDKALFSQPVKLLEYVKEHNINTIMWVPSALSVISRLEAFRYVDLSGTLKRVFFAGEVMPNKQLNIWRKYLPDATYVSLFGSTETQLAIFYIIDRSFRDEDPLPLGFPLPHAEALVLDKDGRPVQDGEIGELCIRGAGLAAGYYGDQEKTKGVFVQNPLNQMTLDTIYRTGDFVKRNHFGEIVYLSRKDSQIKHLGHRIDLGEIERAVTSIEEVGNCCCLYDDAKQCIVLFIDVPLQREYICGRIKNLVPPHMFPGRVTVLDQMPLNANGKIDRKELKAMLL